MGRSSAVVVVVAAVGLATATATAAPAFAAPGVTVAMTRLPGEFTAGGPADPVTVVASRSEGGCSKLRWSLVLRAEGVRLDGVRVKRIEEDGSFPVDVERDANAARITDRRPDPGTLCRDRTVTARYEISVAGDAADAGARLTLAAEAYSTRGRLLDRTTVTREVRPAGAPPSPQQAAGATDAASPRPGATGGGGGLDTDSTSASGVVRVGPIGLAVGAVMVLAGLGLLVKVRRRSRRMRPAGPGAWRGRAELARSPRTTQRRTTQRRTTQRRGKTRPTLTLPPLRR